MKINRLSSVCLHCGKTIEFRPSKRSWVHVEHGGFVESFCPRDGWRGNGAVKECPICQGPLKDDHYAAPRLS